MHSLFKSSSPLVLLVLPLVLVIHFQVLFVLPLVRLLLSLVLLVLFQVLLVLTLFLIIPFQLPGHQACRYSRLKGPHYLATRRASTAD